MGRPLEPLCLRYTIKKKESGLIHWDYGDGHKGVSNYRMCPLCGKDVLGGLCFCDTHGYFWYHIKCVID